MNCCQYQQILLWVYTKIQYPNEHCQEYRESLGLSESDPRHFIRVDFKTETYKILSTPSIGKEITEEGKTSYLIPMDITGLYNSDGTPNREAGYFKIEENKYRWLGVGHP